MQGQAIAGKHLSAALFVCNRFTAVPGLGCRSCRPCSATPARMSTAAAAQWSTMKPGRTGYLLGLPPGVQQVLEHVSPGFGHDLRRSLLTRAQLLATVALSCSAQSSTDTIQSCAILLISHIKAT